jgi:hypothetical protein
MHPYTSSEEDKAVIQLVLGYANLMLRVQADITISSRGILVDIGGRGGCFFTPLKKLGEKYHKLQLHLERKW